MTGLRFLLFYRVSDTEWEPLYGPLSQFAHGAVIHAIVLGLPACLIYDSVRQIRAGKKEYRRVLWWAVLAWPLWFLMAIWHVFVAGSLASFVAFALSSIAFICWAIYGLWRVVPLLLLRRRSRRTAADHLPV
jgi:hypothetical protein